MHPERQRSPSVSLVLIALGVTLGLGSRRYAEHLPGFVAAYAGDMLWAFVAYLMIGLLLPAVSPWRVALVAISFATGIEASQLYHAPWIDAIRRTTLGGLALGYGFLWSDLACYATGVGLGVVTKCLASSVVRRRC
jgi:hypothetical protein